MKITLANQRRSLLKLPSILIDRTTWLGNPFHMGKDGNRKEVIEKYKVYFDQKMIEDKEFRDKFYQMCKRYKHCDQIQLVCWCYPAQCHGEVIKKAMEEILSF